MTTKQTPWQREIAKRNDRIIRLRNAGNTWRQIAATVGGLTFQGCFRIYKAYAAEQKKKQRAVRESEWNNQLAEAKVFSKKASKELWKVSLNHKISNEDALKIAELPKRIQHAEIVKCIAKGYVK